MNNLIVLIALSFISIIFLIIIHRRGQKSETLSFVSTMIATLIGVLLAVTLSNLEDSKREKKDVIKLLSSANTIVTGTYDYSETLGNFIIDLEKDTLSNSEDQIQNIQDNNPIPYPELMENIIASQLVSKNLSTFTHNQVYANLVNLRKLNNYRSLPTYKRILQETSLALKLEIEWQKGHINQERMVELFNIGRDSLTEIYSGRDTSVFSRELEPS